VKWKFKSQLLTTSENGNDIKEHLNSENQKRKSRRN